MFTLIKKYIREDVNIPFFHEVTPAPTEYRELMKIKYIDTKKMLKATTELSNDSKVLTTTILWNTSNDFLDFVIEDSVIFAYARLQHVYNLKNNIRTETASINRE